MSANAEVLPSSGVVNSRDREMVDPGFASAAQNQEWNASEFAREQIRALVRRVFFTRGAGSVRQVVFSAAEPHIDISAICDQVGRALAYETHADIAVVDRRRGERARTPDYWNSARRPSVKGWARQTLINLWYVDDLEIRAGAQDSPTGIHWLPCLADLRSEFEFAVVQGPPCGVSSEASLLAQAADGIVLVIDAQTTRRATVRQIKETLESLHSRILGTVLHGRTFPVPQRICRRL